nr:putative porin [Raoultella sp. NCTC 9187]
MQDVNNGYKPYQTKVQEGDQSYRMFVWGGWYGANVNILPTFTYQYNDYEAGHHDSWYAASLRSVFPFNEFFSIQTEVGYVDNDLVVNNMDQAAAPVRLALFRHLPLTPEWGHHRRFDCSRPMSIVNTM